MNKLVLSGILMLSVCASYAQIYKWTDAQGVVHFSDHPHEGSETVKIPDAQSYSPPASQKTEIPPIDKNLEKKEEAYTSITITQPLNESTVRNNEGYLGVAVDLIPTLFKDNKLQIIFDGSPLGDPQSNPLFQLNGIYRGKHTVAAQVLDQKGEVVITSDSVTFYMFRPRIGMAK